VARQNGPRPATIARHARARPTGRGGARACARPKDRVAPATRPSRSGRRPSPPPPSLSPPRPPFSLADGLEKPANADGAAPPQRRPEQRHRGTRERHHRSASGTSSRPGALQEHREGPTTHGTRLARPRRTRGTAGETRAPAPPRGGADPPPRHQGAGGVIPSPARLGPRPRGEGGEGEGQAGYRTPAFRTPPAGGAEKRGARWQHEKSGPIRSECPSLAWRGLGPARGEHHVTTSIARREAKTARPRHPGGQGAESGKTKASLSFKTRDKTKTAAEQEETPREKATPS
jgi:hypothetical protein